MPSQKANPLFILYGSATGNAEHIAKDLAAQVTAAAAAAMTVNAAAGNHDDDGNDNYRHYFDSVICCELDQFKKKCLPVWEVNLEATSTKTKKKYGVLVIASTTGNGDAPENAGRFARYIKRCKKDVAPLPFRNVCFAVLGLGDTNYDQFCATGILLDKKLEELGGKRAKPLACADEATGLEDVVEPWTATILLEIAKAAAGDDNPHRNNNISNNATMASEQEVAAAVPLLESKNHGKKSVDELENEEKKTAETPSPVSESNAVFAPPDEEEASLGVQMVQSLFTLSNDSRTTMLEKVDPRTLPNLSSLTSRSSSSCELIADGDNETTAATETVRRKSRAASLVSETASSVSAGYHYTARHPFVADILRARYLTRTATAAAQHVATTATAVASSSEGWMKAREIYDDAFPLDITAHENRDNSKDDTDLAKTERNGKRVIELTLSLPDDYTLEYAPGDSLGLLVENTADAVQFVLDMLLQHHNISATRLVSVDENPPVTVREAVAQEMDLCSPIKNKRILYALSQVATDPVEVSCLHWLASKSDVGEQLYTNMVDQQRMNVIDLLKAFPSIQPNLSLEGLLNIVPGIPPRYYSVSSSPISHHLRLTMAFSVVDYLTPSFLVAASGKEVGRRRIRGIATRYMETIASSLLIAAGTSSNNINSSISSHHDASPTLKIFPKPTTDFRMPSMLTTPLILIGPGTGIAPFMGFLQHRQALLQCNDEDTAAQTVVEGTWRGGFELQENELSVSKEDRSGLNVGADYRLKQLLSSDDQHQQGSVDVFFGCRYADHDWLFRDEMKALLDAGIVTKLYTAFSRDSVSSFSCHNNNDNHSHHSHKYVQDIMLADVECGRRLVDLMVRREAAVYVCGDGNSMAKDVQAAIIELLSTLHFHDGGAGGGLDRAKQYLEEMKKNHRFVMDIWS